MSGHTSAMASRILKKEALSNENAKWIKLFQIQWTDPLGRLRSWESAERTTRKGICDGICHDYVIHAAVAIFPILRKKGHGPQTLVITQFRPPVGRHVVELPAGLVDENETPETAAIRELREETGYHGTVRSVTELMVSDPGMSNANMKTVTVDVDLDLELNQNVVAQLEDGEFIERHVVQVRDLLNTLNGMNAL